MAPYFICWRTTWRLVCSSRLPAGARITNEGIRYSNIEPDHEISAEPVPDGCQGTAEPEPVAGGYVSLGDRDEARKTRFGGKQVVIIGVETPIGNPISDREQLPLRVEEKVERHRIEHLLREFAECCEAAVDCRGRFGGALEAVDQSLEFRGGVPA